MLIRPDHPRSRPTQTRRPPTEATPKVQTPGAPPGQKGDMMPLAPPVDEIGALPAITDPPERSRAITAYGRPGGTLPTQPAAARWSDLPAPRGQVGPDGRTAP
jgi:hypothetical protein